MTPVIENYSAIVASLSGMSHAEAVRWVARPEFGYTPEEQRFLLSGRSRCRCLGCSWG